MHGHLHRDRSPPALEPRADLPREVPRRHDADFARASNGDIDATSEALRHVLGQLSAALDSPPYNLVLHSAPLREQVDATYHWHWEIHPRLRSIGGLELGTGLPVNPELLAGALIPLVLLGIWWGTRQLHKKLHAEH